LIGLLLLSGLVACGSNAGHTGTPGSGASCVAPYLDDQPPGGERGAATPTVAPGGVLTIYGHWYTSTCNDTGGDAPLEPLPAVRLVVQLPGGAVQHLGPFTPQGQDLGFTATVPVPPDAPPGTATVRDGRETPATFEVVIGGR